MFGISLSEILLIFIIALIVFGPKQLPQIATKLGTVIWGLKNYFNKLKTEIYHQGGFRDLHQTKMELMHTYQDLKREITRNRPLEEQSVIPILQEIHQLYQPELDFEQQPELF